MDIDQKTIYHVAKLARLNISEDDANHFMADMKKILDYVGKLDELDTQHVSGTHHITENQNVLRADTAKTISGENNLLDPNREKEGYIVVPKIFE